MVRRGLVAHVDPFDLPDWLGTGEVTWTAGSSVHAGHRVRGELRAADDRVECDLLGADQAYPEPVLDDAWRRRVHQAWTYDQVLLVRFEDRLTIAVPGTGFTADLVLEAVSRLAKAVGAAPERYLAALRL